MTLVLFLCAHISTTTYLCIKVLICKKIIIISDINTVMIKVSRNSITIHHYLIVSV